MQADERNAQDRDALLQLFAAELASVAYSVALRHGPAAAWVDLELELWRALVQTVRAWDRGRREGRIPRDPPPDYEDSARVAGGY